MIPYYFTVGITINQSKAGVQKALYLIGATLPENRGTDSI